MAKPRPDALSVALVEEVERSLAEGATVHDDVWRIVASARVWWETGGQGLGADAREAALADVLVPAVDRADARDLAISLLDVFEPPTLPPTELEALEAERRHEREAAQAVADGALALDALRRGHLEAVAPLVAFLEADPYAFRSGYLKADVIRSLTRVDLDEPTKARLRGVVLWVVDAWNRREFRAYVRLARKVWSPGLQAALEGRAATLGYRGAGRRARWILDAVDRHGPID